MNTPHPHFVNIETPPPPPIADMNNLGRRKSVAKKKSTFARKSLICGDYLSYFCIISLIKRDILMIQLQYSIHADTLILLAQGIEGLRMVAEVQIQDEELSNLKQKESSDCVVNSE